MNIDWSQPETIDPLREDVGNFLDVDLNSYRNKAYDAYQSGNYEKAAKYYLFLLRYDIHDANCIYNLACCYGLLEKDVLAAKYLERAVRAGFEDIKQIKQDPDFEKVRGKEVFDAKVDSIALQIEKKQERLRDIIYIDNSALFKCRILLPEIYNQQKSYLLVIGLHGGSGSLDRFITLWEDFGQPEFIYAVPQAPYSYLVGKEIGYDWALWPTGDEKLMEIATEVTEKYITKLVQDLGKRYNVDEVYLMGFSQGAIFTYITGIKNHHLFKGLICFSGPGLLAPLYSPFIGPLDTDWLSEKSIEAAKNLKVFIVHGKDDRDAKYELGIKSRDVLINYGYDVTFCDFEGGHIVPPKEVLEQVVEWMKR
ncbi:MAG: hypothetical protein ACE5K0_01985 [Candidatus Methanofastidiosia archaeon]